MKDYGFKHLSGELLLLDVHTLLSVRSGDAE